MRSFEVPKIDNFRSTSWKGQQLWESGVDRSTQPAVSILDFKGYAVGAQGDIIIIGQSLEFFTSTFTSLRRWLGLMSSACGEAIANVHCFIKGVNQKIHSIKLSFNAYWITLVALHNFEGNQDLFAWTNYQKLEQHPFALFSKSSKLTSARQESRVAGEIIWEQLKLFYWSPNHMSTGVLSGWPSDIS